VGIHKREHERFEDDSRQARVASQRTVPGRSMSIAGSIAESTMGSSGGSSGVSSVGSSTIRQSITNLAREPERDRGSGMSELDGGSAISELAAAPVIRYELADTSSNVSRRYF
jgi:hypothetical protein